ncbi:MAG: T9SS type A sorting domain-containing protein [Bacteroidales bacterium]|nr:T9SS type A sorting domain-containing protein [Bacteroidales bacterium]
MTTKYILADLEITFYPNPCNGQNIVISTDKNIDNVALEIYNDKGQLVFSNKNFSILQEVPKQMQFNLANGIYYFSVLSNDKVIKKEKVVIINSLY